MAKPLATSVSIFPTLNNSNYWDQHVYILLYFSWQKLGKWGAGQIHTSSEELSSLPISSLSINYNGNK